jgi:GTP diphosphokinase / guanosine-3',5'-bis(diphosphate) 3'-diphosphatase
MKINKPDIIISDEIENVELPTNNLWLFDLFQQSDSLTKIFIATEFAKVKHAGQVDDLGKDYFQTHCKVVGQMLETLTRNTNIICAGYLHDILEDTNTTYAELELIFGKTIADLVNEVTHEGTADGYGYYFPRLKSKEAIMIKLCDRASNISRMENWSEKRKIQYILKTKFWKDGSDLK